MNDLRCDVKYNDDKTILLHATKKNGNFIIFEEKAIYDKTPEGLDRAMKHRDKIFSIFKDDDRERKYTGFN